MTNKPRSSAWKTRNRFVGGIPGPCKPNGRIAGAADDPGVGLRPFAHSPQEEMRSWEIAVPIWSKVVTMALESVM